LAAAGGGAAVAAAILSPSRAQAAASQDWPPFVLVTGLLLIGLIADRDRLFSAAGERLAGVSERGTVTFAGAVVLIAVMTAVLNLDTSVAFLTPVLVYAGRRRGTGDAALVYACLLLSNAGSLLLPGSNLTNLIVLGHLHMTGASFAARMALPWALAVALTAGVVAVAYRRDLAHRHQPNGRADRPELGLGGPAVVAGAVIVLTLPQPALPVLAVGVAVGLVDLARGRVSRSEIGEVLGAPTLVGLLGVAIALGTLGRAWSGPAQLLGHLDGWATAAVAAVVSVLLNNLPAASLLASRPPRHPFALLVGLDLGPNLFVTGSLSWILWIRSARRAGYEPSLRQASRLGLIAVPLSMAAALGALTLTGLH
jgi:arsenical pump membrane protein